MTKTLDRDKFHSQPARGVARATMQVIDALQQHAPEAQVAGLAAAFTLACERFGLHVGTAFEAVNRLMRDDAAVEFRAVRMYLQNEVR